jgi:hypothetical protein
MRAVILTILGFVSSAVLVIAVRWATKASLDGCSENPEELRHPRIARILFQVLTPMFLALSILLWFSESSEAQKGLKISVGFTSLCLLGYVESNWTRFYGTDNTLFFRTWTQNGVVAWADISRVLYVPGASYFVLRRRRRRPILICGPMPGFTRLAGIILQQVSPGAISPRARAVLKQAATGYPPWGNELLRQKL